MSNNIIKKCIDELSKENPRQDYVIGMLETLYDIQSVKESTPSMTTRTVALPAGEYIPTPPAAQSLSEFSALKPRVNPVVSPELIAKLRGGATVETINVLNAPKEEPKA